MNIVLSIGEHDSRGGMLRFYKIQSSVKEIEYVLNEGDRGARDLTRSFEFRLMIRTKTDELNARLGCTAHMGISWVSAQEVVVCALAEDEIDIPNICNAHLKDTGIRTGALDVSEITFDTYGPLLGDAYRHDFTQSEDTVYERFGLCEVGRSFNSRVYSETMREPMTSKVVERECRRLLTSGDLKAEMERIRLPKQKECAPGHPVHYIIQTDDDET